MPESILLLLEFHGSESSVAEQAELFGGIAEEFGGTGFEWTANAEDRNKLWSMRHNAHPANKALAPSKGIISTDVCVPISKLAEAIVEAQDKARDLGLSCAIVGHVGDGNYHCGLNVDTSDAEEMKRAKEFVGLLNDSALRLGGTVSGEHGIGLGKTSYMHAEHGPALTFMRAIKAAFDPKGILNPGKILPALNH